MLQQLQRFLINLWTIVGQIYNSNISCRSHFIGVHLFPAAPEAEIVNAEALVTLGHHHPALWVDVAVNE